MSSNTNNVTATAPSSEGGSTRGGPVFVMPVQHKPLPPIELLRTLFSYSKRTGILRWKTIRKSSPAKVGEPAGASYEGRYLILGLYKYGLFAVHRLIYGIVTGQDPGVKEIDHRNGNGFDNRWKNLRLATRNENCRNARLRIDNKSGVKGVFWHKATQAWQAVVVVNNKKINVGRYSSPEAAVENLKRFRKSQHQQFTNHG